MRRKITFGGMVQKVITWFLRGLLITLPLTISIYLLFLIFSWLDGLINLGHPGIGIAIILGAIFIIGVFGTSLITRPIIGLVDTIAERTPGFKIIYSSIKDLLEAFVGEKKKFNKPVRIEVEGEGIYKIGFVTSDSLDSLQMEGYCSVYIPFSYTFTGHLYVVHTSKITPIDGNPTDIMKFVASGGVTQL